MTSVKLFRQRMRAFLVGAMAVGFLMSLSVNDAAALVPKEEAGCINAANKDARAVGKAVAGQYLACIKNYTNLKEGDADTCKTQDPKGKIGKSNTKAGDNYAKKCTDKNGGPPTFGPQNATQVIDAATAKEEDLFAKAFGSVLNDLTQVDDSKNEAKCIQAIAKALFKCQDAKVKEFLACKKAGLKDGSINNASDLQDVCLGTGAGSQPDPKGGIFKKCLDPLKAGLFKDMGKKCDGVDGVDLVSAFGGGDCAAEAASSADDLSNCLEQIVECEVCEMWNAADGLSRNCDEFDNGVVDGSCSGATACDCCAGGFSQVRFETTIGSGSGGTLQKFACTGATDVACVDNTDCDLGICVTIIGACAGNTSVSCTMDSDCLVGPCGEISGSGLPLGLDKGGLYTGAGLNSVPLPLPVPDQGVSYTNIDNCSGDTLDLVAATPADITGEVPANATTAEVGCTQGRTCSVTTSTTCVLDSDCPSTETCNTNCVFGPQLPIPNPDTAATSVCTINHVAEDAAGTTQCSDGATDLVAPLRSVVYLTGDLLSGSVGPVNVADVQPCPLCVRQCDDSSSNDGAPCTSDGDCTGGTCLAQERCLGGPSGQNGGDGAGGSDPASNTICTPGTSASLGTAFPTSHACLLDSGQDITSNIGGLPIDFSLTSGQIVKDATDLPESLRAFSTFCRDVNNGASLAFEGDPAGDPCIGCTSGVAVPCTTDADCQTDTDTYESCAQRDPGAFSKAAATRITVNGSTAGVCLDDGATHAATLVGVFDIPPTFDSTVDGAGDLPGPGAALITGETQLIP